MSDTMLLARGTEIERQPREEWEAQLAAVPASMKQRLAFMSAEHHRVRYFVVEQLARRGRPLPPPEIAAELGLPLDRVVEIVRELEKQLFFLVRKDDGFVSWAFPLTVDRTPHALAFSTGERCFAA
ncbi:MAG TPA: hypothetical protein VEZ11_11735 [Thermoanaerobaculia bacterium]|nr:hypothetical protein [Thermoanaerobaculia bacterium]